MRSLKSLSFMGIKLGFLLLLLNLSYHPILHAADQQLFLCNGKQVVGGIEKIVLDKNLTLDAKLDTGAKMSSLSASNIQVIKRHHKTWVEFSVYSPLKKTEVKFIKPFVKYVSILKRDEEMLKTLDSSPQQVAKRIVVPFDLCMGKQKLMIEVNLANRKYFQYPFLIGQSALKKFHVLVDVSQTHVTTTDCSSTK